MKNSNKIILVTGATGKQGGAIAKRLLKDGSFTVHALVRDKTKDAALELEKGGAILVEGDFSNQASLDEAMRNVYGVFSVQIVHENPEDEVTEGKAVADAAKAAGVQHFLYSSVGSAERNTGIAHFESKFQVEKHIRTIDLPYTILRPVFFLYNYEMMKQMIEGGSLFMPLSNETKLQQISEEDYANMVLEVFKRPSEFLGVEKEVAGLELTPIEIADIFSDVLGMTIQYQKVPFEVYEQQVGEEMTTMFRWFEEDGYKADLKELPSLFSQTTSLEAYLRAHQWNGGKAGNRNL